MKFYLKCDSDNGLKEALKIKSLNSVKVLNLRRLEHEFSSSMWFDFIAMQFIADTTDFPAICHVSDNKDITQNRRETSLHYKQFGKGIVKYNAFKQNFTLFCSTSEPKGVSFTLWIFRWRIFDRRDVLYALGNDKVENDQPPEAANVLYWFEKVPYLLCWKLGRTLHFLWPVLVILWSPRMGEKWICLSSFYLLFYMYLIVVFLLFISGQAEFPRAVTKTQECRDWLRFRCNERNMWENTKSDCSVKKSCFSQHSGEHWSVLMQVLP